MTESSVTYTVHIAPDALNKATTEFDLGNEVLNTNTGYNTCVSKFSVDSSTLPVAIVPAMTPRRVASNGIYTKLIVISKQYIIDSHEYYFPLHESRRENVGGTNVGNQQLSIQALTYKNDNVNRDIETIPTMTSEK